MKLFVPRVDDSVFSSLDTSDRHGAVGTHHGRSAVHKDDEMSCKMMHTED